MFFSFFSPASLRQTLYITYRVYFSSFFPPPVRSVRAVVRETETDDQGITSAAISCRETGEIGRKGNRRCIVIRNNNNNKGKSCTHRYTHVLCTHAKKEKYDGRARGIEKCTRNKRTVRGRYYFARLPHTSCEGGGRVVEGRRERKIATAVSGGLGPVDPPRRSDVSIFVAPVDQQVITGVEGTD